MQRTFLIFFVRLLIIFILLESTVLPLIEGIYSHYYQDQIKVQIVENWKGTLYLLDASLNQYPENQLQNRLKRIAPYFGYPIILKKNSELDLNPVDQRQLTQNGVLFKMDRHLIYKKISLSQWIMVLGPFPENEAIESRYEIIAWVSGIAYIGAFAILWTLLFWRKLNHIITTALAFGNGRFEVRAKVPRHSSLATLANAFNSMADRIQQLMATQRELTNAVSHELRTPLTRIRFSLEMLSEAEKAPDRKHYINEIELDIKELEELVAEYLTYARFDQKTSEIELQACRLAPWIQQLATNSIKGRDRFFFDFRNFLTPSDSAAYLEPRFMGRAVGNLIQNAVKHAQNRVEVTLTRNGKTCIIYVDDDGSGIPYADRKRVFKAFTRLDTSRNRTSGGYGLGLAIVERVVTLHDGRVWVSDSPLGGARLTIQWPGFGAEPPPAGSS